MLVTSDELRCIELDSWFHIRLFVSQGETFHHTIGTTSKTSSFIQKANKIVVHYQTNETCKPQPGIQHITEY